VLPSDADLEVGGATGADKTGLDEVVVTVDRRKKDLQDYSGTAQAFSEKQLSAVGIYGVAGLATKVPGLAIATEEGNTEVYIRGIGNDNNAEHGDMGVALHLDGVYLPRPRGVGSLFYDIERVEVNSGPQGTVRGRNAQGGSVNIISNKPKLKEFGANAEATFGTFAERRYQGMVNIPLGDSVAFRFAGFSSVHDPHWSNGSPIYDLTAAQSEDTYAFRGQVKWQPAKPLSIIAAPGDRLKEQVSPGRLGLMRPSDLTYRLRGLVQLRRDPDHRGDAELERLATVDGLPELVAQTSYTRQMERPLHELAELAHRVGGVRRVTYAEAEQLRPVVRSILDGDA